MCVCVCVRTRLSGSRTLGDRTGRNGEKRGEVGESGEEAGGGRADCKNLEGRRDGRTERMKDVRKKQKWKD